MEERCKFCGKKITTDHYFISRSGAVCTGCKDQVRSMLKGIVKIKKGEEHETGSIANIRADMHMDIS